LATIHPTARADEGWRLHLLRMSALGFAALIDVLALGFFLVVVALTSPMKAISSSDVRFLVDPAT
jgi:hypothetical protein